MYCPHCGEGSTFGLKYCKKCGEALNFTADTTQPAQQPSNRITSPAWAIAMATTAISLIGIATVLEFVTDFLRPMPIGQAPHGDSTLIGVLMIIFGSLTVFGSVAMLIRLFSKLMLPTHQREQHRGKAEKVDDIRYGPPQIQQPPTLSVTEHTTRNFEPRYKQPVARE